MTKFGVAISQEGVQVSKAADTQKVLDSRWKYLNIAAEDTVPISYNLSTNSVTLVPLVRHRLGYLPAFTIQADVVSGLEDDDISVRFVADDEYTYMVMNYLHIATSSLVVEATIRVRVFDLDITKSYKATIQKPAPNIGNVDSFYGAKVLDEEGGSLRSSDIEDYTLNTKTKAICVQEHGIVRAAGGVLTIIHNFGTPPAFAIAKTYESGLNYGVNGMILPDRPLIATINSTEGIGTVTPQDLVLGGAQYGLSEGEKFAYVLFKDPLETDL